MTIKQLFRKDNPFDYVVLGFILRIIGDLVSLFVNKHISDALFGVVSWYLIIKGFKKIPERLALPFGKEYSLLFRFYILLTIIMLVRGCLIDYNYPWWTTAGAINMLLFDEHYWLWSLMPFSVLIPVKYYNFRLIVLYASIFAFVTLFVTIYFRNELLQATIMGAAGLMEKDAFSADSIAFYSIFAFVPLFYCYLPHRTWLINVGGLLVWLLLMIVGARRGGVLFSSFLLFSSIYLYTSSKKAGVRIAVRFIMVIIVLAAIYLIINSFLSSFLLERGMNDNRTGVEESMLSQMTPLEQLFGMGLNGRYYFPLFEDDELMGWRYGIETGFLNIVLKGGYLMAFTHILLLVIPAFKGLFKSKNLFCKAGGFFILYNLISLWPFGHLLFNLNFLFMWMMVVCCMDKKIRSMSDDEIKNSFFYNLK